MHNVQRSHVGGLVQCTRVCAFNCFHGVEWREVLSWYPVEWVGCMESVIGKSEIHQACSGIGDTRGPGWKLDPSATTYHFLDTRIDYGIGGIVDPMIEHMYLLGKFQLALMSSQCVRELHGSSGYDCYVWGHEIINTL